MSTSRALPVLTLAGLVALAATGSGASVNHWTPAGPTAPTVSALAFDPLVPERIYAGTHGEGFYLTEDGGNRWRPARISGQVPPLVLTLFARPRWIAKGRARMY